MKYSIKEEYAEYIRDRKSEAREVYWSIYRFMDENQYNMTPKERDRIHYLMTLYDDLDACYANFARCTMNWIDMTTSTKPIFVDPLRKNAAELTERAMRSLDVILQRVTRRKSRIMKKTAKQAKKKGGRK